MIIRPKDLLLNINDLYHKGVSRGSGTGWPSLDEYWSVKPGEFTLLTGIPSHGKSEWLDNLVVNLAMHHNFRIAIFSPENHPLELHAAKIMEKYAQDKFFGKERMSHGDMMDCLKLMDKSFAFIKPSETEFTPMHIINEALPWLDASITQPRAMIIDPWNEMDHYRPNGLTETEYISRILTELRRAAREFKTHLFLVAHPTKMPKGANGKYLVPRPYDISGSSHWYNKADNCIAIWRDIEESPDMTEVHIQKVRFKWTGKPGMVTLRYNHDTSSYDEPNKAFAPQRNAYIDN